MSKKKPNSNFINLSSAIYNSSSQDKTMYVEMEEIDFIISIESIMIDNDDKDNLYKLIGSSYSSIFDEEFINDIEGLTIEDYKDICVYHRKRNTFSGIEYYILRHLKDYHIKMFRDDVRNGRLNSIMKLAVSKGNLIVKLFPKKSSDDCPVSYCFSLLYLVLLHLYKETNRHVYEHNKKYNTKFLSADKFVNWVLKNAFISLNPLVSKVKYTLTVNADNNYSRFTELKQLHPAYKFLLIKQDENQVEFVFRPKSHYLTNTIDNEVTNHALSDSNYCKREIKCNYKLNKDNLLTCRTTIISRDMVNAVFSFSIDESEYNSLAPMLSRLCDEEDIYLAQYSILERLLSYTQEHEALRKSTFNKAQELVAKDKFKTFAEIDDESKAKLLAKIHTKKNAFRNLKETPQDDKLLIHIKNELIKLGQKNNFVSYIIVVMELYKEEKSVIDSTLASLDNRTSDRIKKVIRKIKKLKVPPVYNLNKFYKEA